MATADIYRSVDGIGRALDNMDLVTLAGLSVLTAPGVFVAQETIDFVMPKVGRSADPSSTQDLALAGALKLAGAVGLYMATDMVGGRTINGLGTVMAVGMLVHAGADGIDLVQNLLDSSGLTGSSTSRRRSSARKTRQRSTRRARSTSRRGGAGSTGNWGTAGTSASTPTQTRREENASWA